jgi:hypothetical protein
VPPHHQQTAAVREMGAEEKDAMPADSPSPSPPSSLVLVDDSAQSRIRSSLHRLFTRHATTSLSFRKKEPKKNRRMMTSGQLSDLFRRLDKDGNGELDLEEFTQIISKLQMNVGEEFVAK